MIDRVLIYRPGTLGDTIITLPCFHLIRRRFPAARIRMMTDSRSGLNVSAPSVLANCGLVDDYITYPKGLRNLKSLAEVRRQIKDWQPEITIYLPPQSPMIKIVRDVVLFRLCGLTNVIGVPWSREFRLCQPVSRTVLEHEARRLARCLGRLGVVDLDDPANWDLHQTVDERRKVETAIRGWAGRARYVALSLGTTLTVNDWGFANWRTVIKELSRLMPELGLLMLGGNNDRAQSDALLHDWVGPSLNLCGTVSPRESALLLRDALIYLGNDSGPMHLAASVGTPCVCVFSRHSLPGCWFPYGQGHHPLYPFLRDGRIGREDAGISEILPKQVIDSAMLAFASVEGASVRLTSAIMV